MKSRDLLRLAFSALAQQKVRTALTLLGVIVGTFALVLSLALGRGLDGAVLGLFRGQKTLRTVRAMLNYEGKPDPDAGRELEIAGTMSDAKRARIRRALVRQLGQSRPVEPRVKLNRAGLEQLRHLPHVVELIPEVTLTVGARLEDGRPALDVLLVSAAPHDRGYRDRIVAGRALRPGDRDAILVGEFLAYRWGFASEAEVRQLLGRRVRLRNTIRGAQAYVLRELMGIVGRRVSDEEFARLQAAIARLNALLPLAPLGREERETLRTFLKRLSSPEIRDVFATTAAEFTIVGVFRAWEESDEKPGHEANGSLTAAELIVAPDTGLDFAFSNPRAAEEGLNQVNITVDDEANVEAVAKQVEQLGYYQYSLVTLIRTVRMNITLVTLAMAFVAVVALAVAALGITNTMVMSVLERTREIGIFKAVGAREGHILAIFLVEGLAIGLLGGLLGLGLARLAAIPGDAIARSIAEPQTQEAITQPMFAFPPWLIVGGPAITCAVTTLAALYPAIRAARVDPIASLRHE
jgi:putative ABC transport system permease protein